MTTYLSLFNRHWQLACKMAVRRRFRRRLEVKKKDRIKKQRVEKLRATKAQDKIQIAKQFVTNLSDYKMTNREIFALSRGLKFIPVPPKPKVKDLLKDFDELARKMRCTFFMENPEIPDKEREMHPFRRNTNFQPPKGNHALETFLWNTREEISHLRLQKIQPNFSKKDREAIANLRRNRNIVIKKADKNSTLVILNRTDYVKEAMAQLQSRHYEQIPRPNLNDLHNKIMRATSILHAAHSFDDQTAKFLTETSNNPRGAHLYLLPKIHKRSVAELKTAEEQGLKDLRIPGRPIVSQVNSATYHLGFVVDHYLKPFVRRLPYYTEDTSDLLRRLQTISFPQNIKCCAFDIRQMYTSLPQHLILEATLEALPETVHVPPLPEISREDIVTLLRLVICNNTFEFDGNFYYQNTGVSMGAVCSPQCTDLLMGRVIQEVLAKVPDPHIVKETRLYRDDGVLFIDADDEQIHQIFKWANEHTPGVEFEYEISQNEITFLDVTLYKGPHFRESGHFDTKLFRKPTEKFNYLHYSSAHPPAVFKGLVKGETIRTRRICSDENTALSEVAFFHDKLEQRGYPKAMLEEQSKSIMNIPREQLLQKRQQNKRKRDKKPPLVFVSTYHPSIKDLSRKIKKHWSIIERDPECSKLFPKPPLTAYRRAPNLKDLLIQSKLPPLKTD